MLEDFVDPLFDRRQAQHPRDGDRPGGADRWARLIAWSSTAGFHQRSNKKHIFAELQIQPDARRRRSSSGSHASIVFLELLEHGVALLRRHLPVIFERTKPAQLMRQNVDAFDPLAEDDCLPAAGGDLFQVGRQPLELRLVPVAGSKLQICFSRKTSSNTC